MSAYYFDASALVKRYTQESGSTWVRQITDPATDNTILLSENTLVEVSAALAAKHRASDGITEEQRNPLNHSEGKIESANYIEEAPENQNGQEPV